MSGWNRILIIYLIFFLILPLGYAGDSSSSYQMPSSAFSRDLMIPGATPTLPASKGNEFTSGEFPGAVLMKVNLWGAVWKSGIHYVPVQTDLITLLSYAGGPTEAAKLDSIIIKRWVDGKENIIKVNGQELLHETGTESPVLQQNDIIIIPNKVPLVSQDTAVFVGIFTGIASILISLAVLIRH